MEFLNLKDINFEDIKFSKTKNKQSKRFILAYYNKKPICVKLPLLSVRNNVSKNSYNQIELFLNITEEIADKLQELDNLLPKFGKTNEWFSSSDDTYSYIPTLKNYNDEGSFMKVKIDLSQTLFFNNLNEEIQINNENEIFNLLRKGTEIRIGIRTTGVWFIENRYGLSWRAEQIKVVKQAPEEKDVSSDEDNFLSSDDENIASGDEECWLD